MKPKRFKVRLSAEQQLILSLVLVILLAISILYCLGFASIVLRQTWENAPLPRNDTGLPEESMELPLTSPIEPTGVVPLP